MRLIICEIIIFKIWYLFVCEILLDNDVELMILEGIIIKIEVIKIKKKYEGEY